ncbi:uncharacterized protein LOC113217220 isoform X2 [Frankliniella occidentalis]|uniref:Uncharacterized protein LOC113217220 isoform X2 n=1 Tax=Frankliniella occidentalis TaxID=133901 RepID=A0A6J1TJA4_FRAOC|nr:uncharacterized protein LOC113217220 isoform X2 [Frankliniella occidentalis]XP_026292828.2 uncharacterized protein LOC113217220 isoform X2 [Frankliniella occidentalis]XP_052128136.1 uncharacterized protein LOC113217220 isoform X2 [Frankliniella occidentalis]XP_052128137.1 uncharacterized protein LOC113217220 isoform X2 [Frankliniella occidentalis]XP_052128138.1 uncharacterized protein LOC113217220 isoform X2 [Frankliniella occidentalis]
MALRVLLIMLTIQTWSLSEPIAGPYDVFIDQVGECPQGLVDPFFPVKIRLVRNRHNHNDMFAFANYTIIERLDDSSSMRLEFGSWSSGGGWKENAFIMKFQRLCSTLHNLAPRTVQALERSLSNSKNVSPVTCPWNPDTYQITNFSTLEIKSNVPAVFYGKWRINLIIFNSKTQTAIACCRVYARTTPKIPLVKTSN